MILTCPECATSYFVDDSRIPEGGRTVKCTNCGARWHTARDAGASDADRELFEEATSSAAGAAEPAAATAPEDDLEVSGPEPVRRPRPAPPAPSKKPTAAIVAWGALAAMVALVVVGALVFRDNVVRLAPQTSGAYAGLGVPVNTLGLVIENVRTEAVFHGGRPVVAVTGQIRNLRSESAHAPAIRIDMLSRSGQHLAAKIVRPVDPSVPGGSTRYFAVALEEPPSRIGSLDLAFEPPSGHAAPAPVRAEVHAAESGGHGEPMEAQPLPADAPDALSDHHG